MGNVLIKGNKEGIFIHINSNDFEGVKNEVMTRIESGKDFFTGSKVVLVDDKKQLPENGFQELQGILKEHFSITAEFQDNDNAEKQEKVFSGIYEGRTKFIKNTIRSGQKIVYNGNVVIIGDVNSGSEVVAAGNILVLGVLRGIAHAGFNGNKRAFVAAYKLQPEQLRISEVICRAPDQRGSQAPGVPELAKIKGEIIVIEPYLPNKYV